MPIADPRQPGTHHGDLADRILDAARRLLMRTGARKMSLSDVATLAGVSRPTIYRYFVSKEELIDALGRRERRRFKMAMDDAISGVVGTARLEAAVDVVARFVEEQPPGRMLDLEPGFVQDQMAIALPMITEELTVVLRECVLEDGIDSVITPRDLAGAIGRTALSHYMFPDPDHAAARREILAAAGLADPASARTHGVGT